MKLKYERFEGLGCLSIRGVIDSKQYPLLTVGLESITSDLEETLLVNLSNATITDPTLVHRLTELKKKLTTLTKQKVYWICKERAIGDFATTDLFISRLTGFKFRQIGDRIKLDDQLYVLTEEVKQAEARMHELGGDEQNARNLLLNNQILREQKRILEQCVQWQQFRLNHQTPIATTDSEVPQKMADALKELTEAMKKAYGTEVDV